MTCHIALKQFNWMVPVFYYVHILQVIFISEMQRLVCVRKLYMFHRPTQLRQASTINRIKRTRDPKTERVHA
jgi:hypothetical protein